MKPEILAAYPAASGRDRCKPNRSLAITLEPAPDYWFANERMRDGASQDDSTQITGQSWRDAWLRIWNQWHTAPRRQRTSDDGDEWLGIG
ncbi:MAG: hypothetical protein ACFCUJ_11285 [Thiotrichales bacterium]